MLNFILKKNWYEKIKSGEKTIEYREAKNYWYNRIGNELKKQCAFKEDMELFYRFSRGHRIDIVNIDCVLRLGYTKKYMTATIDTIELINGKNTDLHIDKPVYAIHLSDVQEIKIEPLEIHMTDEEKGYHCPHNPKKGIDCYNCPFQASKCIVYSATGRKKLREW